jgi:hypothetical protein
MCQDETDISNLAACRREEELSQLLAWIAKSRPKQGRNKAKTRWALPDLAIWQSPGATFQVLRQPARA